MPNRYIQTRNYKCGEFQSLREEIYQENYDNHLHYTGDSYEQTARKMERKIA